MDIKLLTVKDVAEILRIKEKTVREMLRNEKLKGFKIENSWRVKKEDLEKYIDEKMDA